MPAKRVELSAAAEAEAAEAHDWYLARSPAVATRFRSALAAASSQLGENPQSAPVWTGADTVLPVRILVLRGFPYCLFYVEGDEVVRVLAVAHTSRRPGYWIAR